MSFSPIRVSTIKPALPITFTLHILFKEQYITYAKPGTQIDKDKLKKLRKQKMAKFFITGDEESVYQQYLDSILDNAINSDDMDIKDKADIVTGASMNAVEAMRKDPGSKQAFTTTENASKGLVSLIHKDPSVLKEMLKIESDEDVTLKTAVNATGLAIRIAEFKKFNAQTIESMSIGSMIRDIGITQMDNKYQELFSKPLEEFEDIELKIYKTHPTLGQKILEEKPHISKEVLDYVITHEEKISGTGFPNKIKKLTPEQEIVSMCSCYDRKVTCLNIAPKEAIQSMNIDELGNYELDNINLLKKVLNQDGLLELD